jgi:AcrR family transcriptional regulator
MVTKQAPADARVELSDAGEADEERPMRADARRNRERLLVAAREVFAEQGAGAPLEAIARQAGVGVGTLYRHFPTRLDVVEAVYEEDVEELAETARRVVSELEPWPAVEAFFEAFIQYARRKHTFLTELHQAFEKNPALRSRARAAIDSSFDLVIDRAKKAGVVRSDIESADIPQLVAPICSNTSIPPEQTLRLFSLVLDGLRAAPQPKPA